MRQQCMDSTERAELINFRVHFANILAMFWPSIHAYTMFESQNSVKS